MPEPIDTLEDAISAYIAQVKPGRVVGGYQLTVHMVDTTTPDDPHEYWFVHPAGQPFHVTRGLLSVASEDAMSVTFFTDEEDE